MFPRNERVTTKGAEASCHSNKTTNTYLHPFCLCTPIHATLNHFLIMKKHQILSICLCILLAATLSNCNKTDAPQPGSGRSTSRTLQTTAVGPIFSGTGPSANELENLTGDFVRVSTYLTKPGASKVLQHGHVWNESLQSPYISTVPQQASFQTELGPISESEVFPYGFTSYVKYLTPGTSYFVRAYVVTKEGAFYGPSTQFQTTSKKSIQ